MKKLDVCLFGEIDVWLNMNAFFLGQQYSRTCSHDSTSPEETASQRD